VSHLIKISFRRFARERVFSTINILGLSLGMASSIVILLFLHYETSYDTYHPSHNLIYRVATDLVILDHRQGYAVSSAPIAPALTADYSQIESFLRIFPSGYFLHDVVFRHEEKFLSDSGIFAVDSTFFEFFSCEFLRGSARDALVKPFSFVFTRSLALSFFGHIDVIGESLVLSDGNRFEITAVIEDPPLNTQFRFSALFSLSSLPLMAGMFEYAFGPGMSWETFERTFGSTVVWSYIKVAESFNSSDFLVNEWPLFHQRHISELIVGRQYDMEPIFQPMASIHLGSNLIYELSSERDNMQIMNNDMVIVFFVIALFLIFVAAVNYTNMAISRFNKRRKEMAMVKILGSKAQHLFAGFFAEAFITAFLALVVSLVFLELILGQVNSLLNISLSLDLSGNIETLVVVLSVFVLSAVLSGLFPALYFVYTPAYRLLAKRFKTGNKTQSLKKVLMLAQFAIAVFMISAAFIVYSQFDYMQHMDLGYKVDNISVVEIQARENKERVNELEDILMEYTQIQEVARTNYVLSMYPIKHTVLFEYDDSYVVRSFNNIQTTEDYLRLMGINIYLDDTTVANSELLVGNGVLVNKVLSDSLRYDNPIGKSLVTHYQFLEGRQRQNRIIEGYVDNFHYALLNKPVEPLVILPLLPNRVRYLAIEFEPIAKNERNSIIEGAWKQFGTISPLRYFHMEDNVSDFFAYNQNLSRFFSYFAWLCVFISFLGVFGITAYNIEQRGIEIAIRKVMGAGGLDFFLMFFTNYALLFLIGAIIGLGASSFLLTKWLNSFSFSLELSIYPLLRAAFMVGITIFTAIFVHIIRIINLNPTDYLRKE
jgi:putative ABC transport system permease protein